MRDAPHPLPAHRSRRTATVSSGRRWSPPMCRLAGSPAAAGPAGAFRGRHTRALRRRPECLQSAVLAPAPGGRLSSNEKTPATDAAVNSPTLWPSTSIGRPRPTNRHSAASAWRARRIAVLLQKVSSMVIAGLKPRRHIGALRHNPEPCRHGPSAPNIQHRPSSDSPRTSSHDRVAIVERRPEHRAYRRADGPSAYLTLRSLSGEQPRHAHRPPRVAPPGCGGLSSTTDAAPFSARPTISAPLARRSRCPVKMTWRPALAVAQISANAIAVRPNRAWRRTPLQSTMPPDPWRRAPYVRRSVFPRRSSFEF